jgi:hypothetical protein
VLRGPVLDRLRAACAWRGGDETSLVEAIEKTFADYMSQRDSRAEAAGRQAEQALKELTEMKVKLAVAETKVREATADKLATEQVVQTLRDRLAAVRAELAELQAQAKPGGPAPSTS